MVFRYRLMAVGVSPDAAYSFIIQTTLGYSDSSTKRRRHGIRNNQLVLSFEALHN